LGVGGRKNKRKREKVKAHGLRSMGLLFLNDERYADPPSAVLTLTHNYPEELLGLKRLAP
jgi:hypothetical protein